jgi:hypothetical protein
MIIFLPKSLKILKNLSFPLQGEEITAKILVVGMGKRKEELTRGGTSSGRDKRQNYLHQDQDKMGPKNADPEKK